MGQIKTMLTATDLSAPARHAAARAVRLTRDTGALRYAAGAPGELGDLSMAGDPVSA